MAMIADMVRRLGAAGCTVEQIAVAVELAEQEANARAARQSEKNAARQRRYREGKRNVTQQDVARRNEQLPPPAYTTPPKENSEPKKVLRSARKIPLPPDWSPSEKGRAQARAEGWDDQRLASEVQRFRNHAVAGGRKQVDWDAAWQNWVTSPFQKPNSAARGRGPPKANGFLDVALKIEQNEHERDHDLLEQIPGPGH